MASYDVRTLRRGHEDLERLLIVLESHVARILSSEQPDTRLMREIVVRISEYIDRVHAPRERAAFRALLDRLPWLAALIEEHARQREVVRATGARLVDALEHDVAKRETLEFIVAMRRHILIEEVELLPAVEIMDAPSGPARDEPPEADPEEERYHAILTELSRAAGCNGDRE